MSSKESKSFLLDTRREPSLPNMDELTESSLEKLLQEFDSGDEKEEKFKVGILDAGAQKRTNIDTGINDFKSKKSRVLRDEDSKKPTLKEMLSVSVKDEPSTDYMDTCVLCGKQLQERSGSVNQPNLRFHYAQEHYFAAGSFSKIAPSAEPLEEGELLPKDIMGRVYKYTCPFHCTRRRMGYKEHVLHLATQHHKLKDVMKVDTRPGIDKVLIYLYPETRAEGATLKKDVLGEPTIKREATFENEDNSEDVDDPSWEPEGAKVEKVMQGGKSPAARKMKWERVSVSNGNNVENSSWQSPKVRNGSNPIVDKIHSCVFCDTKEGKTLNLGSGMQDLRYHYAVCYYRRGNFFSVIDPGKENMDEEGKVIDEFGRRFRYKCPIQNCHKNQGRGKTSGYKEFCIHTGVAHHMVEYLLSQEEDPLPGMEEVRQAMETVREKDGGKMGPLPPVPVEEIHTCLLCKGKDKEGLNLSFAGYKLCQTRYHYASCYYDSGVYLDLYSPGKANRDEEGKVIDVMGRRVKYTCNEKCSLKREMGYKELCIHMSNEHGGLEAVMMNDERPEVRQILEKLRKP